tara:strand:- start:2 stop:1522 length:1521 start_codon:yes stop_codon:yes gene_type:complete
MKNLTREYGDNVHYREFELDVSRADTENKVIPASLSSETPVQRWFGDEVLVHTPEAVNLERAQGNGLAMLFSHKTDEPIGKIREVRIEGNRLVGDLHFANTTRAKEVYQMVVDRHLDSMSIGYRVHKWVESDDDERVEVVSWSLLEGSVVAVGADPTVGPNRSEKLNEENVMKTKAGDEAGDENNSSSVVVQMRTAKKEGMQEGTRAERERVAKINEIFIPERYQNVDCLALREEAINAGWTEHETREHLLNLIGEGIQAVSSPSVSQARKDSDFGVSKMHVQAGNTDLERFTEGVTEALMCRGNVIFDESGKLDNKKLQEVRTQNEFVNLPLMEIVRHYCDLVRIDKKGSPEAMVSRAMNYRAGGLSNADLPAIIENIMGKMMQTPLSAEMETWRPLVKISNLSDFKQTSRVNMGSASDLEEVGPGSPIRRGYIADFKEYLKARTFGVELVVTYQTLRNDDIGALTTLPLEMRRKASRKVGDIVWGILTGNLYVVKTFWTVGGLT